jgi:23S rRNA (uracil1939-C5)-methyltransferase
MVVHIEKIVYPGGRLARVEGRVYLTDEGLPGEDVEIVALREHKSYVEARTERIVAPSPHRQEPRCPHYLACSSYQAMDDAFQLETKASQLGEILAPLEAEAVDRLSFTPSPKIWRYRNRIRLSLVYRDGRARTAYHVPGNREEFSFADECHLASETANAVLNDVGAAASENKISSLREVEVRESASSGKILVSLFWGERPKTRAVDPLISRLAGRFPLAGIVSFHREKGILRESIEWGGDPIRESMGETLFEIGASTFFQVNLSILPAVLEALRKWGGFQGGEKVVDLYGGIGTFGLSLARFVKSVAVVESDPTNVRYLGKNIKLNKAPNVTVHEGPSEEWMPWLTGEAPDVVIVDPPRKGLAREVVEALAAGPAKNIFYLSCNPTTLARDLAALRESYEIAHVQGFDFFPQTPHIEALAVLQRRR